MYVPPTVPQLAQLQDSVAESDSRVQSLEAVLAESRQHSQHLEEELTAAEEKQIALEQSRSVLESVGAERLGLITSLQSEVEAGRVREGQMAEMREKLATLEQLLCSLQDEVRDACFLSENSSLLYPLSLSPIPTLPPCLPPPLSLLSPSVGVYPATEQRTRRCSASCRDYHHTDRDTADDREERERRGEEGKRGESMGSY